MDIQGAFRGFDTARFLKSTLAELIFGNENIAIETGIRSDNSSVVVRAHSISSVKKGRRLNGFLESNRESETNRWLSLSHIAAPLNISDGVGNSTTQTMLSLPIPRNISRTRSEKR